MTDCPNYDSSDPNVEFDLSSSMNFYHSILKVHQESRKARKRQARSDENREFDIIIMHSHEKTLDDIGRFFGVTRERVRQIESRIWHQIALYKKGLSKLEEILVSVLKKSGGFEKVSTYQKCLAEQLGWSDSETHYLLFHLLDVFSDRFFLDKDKTYISLTDYQCWRCIHFKQMVRNAVHAVEEQNTSVTFDEFAHIIRKKMGQCSYCAVCSAKVSMVSLELLSSIFKRDPELSVFQEKLTVRQSSHFLGLNRSVLLVLKMAKRPLTKKQILLQLKSLYPDQNFTIKQIQSSTSNSSRCSDKIFLWNRGGAYSDTLFVHEDFVKTDLPILDTIEKILVQQANEGNVPQVRLNAIFNEHSDECRKEGIPNVYALFSCLKARKCPQLSFQRAPYIGFEGNSLKISNAKILEDYVRKSDHPVTRQEMRDFGRSLGLQNEHVSNTVILTNLLSTQRGYVYRDDAPEKSDEFDVLIENAKKKLESVPAFTVLEFFRSEKEICKKLNIVDAKMLHSLLKRRNDPGINLRYPLIFRPDLETIPKMADWATQD